MQLYPQGRSRWYPLDRRLGEPQSRSGRGGEEKNSQLLSGLELPFIQLEAQRYTTGLSRLRNCYTTNTKLLLLFLCFFLILLSSFCGLGIEQNKIRHTNFSLDPK
jgi:hypothetical protein